MAEDVFLFSVYEMIDRTKGEWVAGASDLASAVAAASAFFVARQTSSHLDIHWGLAVFDDSNQMLCQIGPKGAW